MRPKNLRYYLAPEFGRDLKWLKDTQQDYRSLGFYTELKDGVLTVFAIPPKKPKKKEADKRGRNSDGARAGRDNERRNPRSDG